VLTTQSPRMPLATETGERCFTSHIDQIGLTGILSFTLQVLKITTQNGKNLENAIVKRLAIKNIYTYAHGLHSL
jgi:hypothetical protein